MLEGKQIMDKLYEQADMFKHYMINRNYEQAKQCYDTALNISVFLQLDEKSMIELFGERGEKGEYISKGLFPEEQEIKAEDEIRKEKVRRITAAAMSMG